MIPKFIDKYEEREFYGREALKELKEIYPQYFKWELHFTSGKYDKYDAFYFVMDLDTMNISKRVFIELKHRDTEFDEYILEKKKVSSLKSLISSMGLSENEYSILYINFCPRNTIIWDISKIDVNNTKKLMANKATSSSRTDKTNKDVIYLKPEEGKVINYSLNRDALNRKWEANYLIPLVEKKIKKVKGLEDIIFQ